MRWYSAFPVVLLLSEDLERQFPLGIDVEQSLLMGGCKLLRYSQSMLSGAGESQDNLLVMLLRLRVLFSGILSKSHTHTQHTHMCFKDVLHSVMHNSKK